MWDLFTEESRQRVGTGGFIDRLPRIAEEMTLRSLEATTGPSTREKLPSGSPDPRSATVPLDVTFHTTRVGDFTRSTTLSLVMVGEKDKAVWRISWSPEAILPKLSAGRLVRMTRVATSRGRIIAREGTELATFIDGATVGAVPGQMRSEDGLATSLAPILGLRPDEIKAKLHQSWVRADTFVPIRTLAGASLTAARPKLAVIEGVQLQATRVRSYPTGLASQTLGYLAEAGDVEAQKRAMLSASAFANALRSNVGRLAIARISPLQGSSATSAPLRSPSAFSAASCSAGSSESTTSRPWTGAVSPSNSATSPFGSMIVRRQP